MTGLHPHLPRPRQALLFLVDSLVLVLTLLAAQATRFHEDLTGLVRRDPLFLSVVVTTLVVQACMYYSELYDDRAMRWHSELLRRVGQSFVAAVVLLSLIYYLAPSVKLGRGIILIYVAMAVSGILLWRSLHQWLGSHEALSENVLIMGTGVSAQQTAIEILKRAPLGYRVVGFLGEHQAEVGRRLVNPSVIGTTGDLLPLVEKLGVKRIVVALEDRRGKMPVNELLACRMKGVKVDEASSFFESITGKILISNLRPSWLVFSQGFNKPRLLSNSKRVIELVVACVLLVLSAPLLAVLVILVRLESRGPALFRQERVGQFGLLFNLLKLRTMRLDAEAATGPVWASAESDPRVTRVGRWLRKTRLDELPQLINVVRGEMSFVGPRPERLHFVEHFRKIIPYYNERHTVKPGITGWAQIKFRYGSTIEDAEEKHQYDLYYIKRMSLFFDFIILLQTMKVVLFGKGAR